MRRIFVSSLGCPKNLTDSEELLGVLVDQGYEVVYNEENADVVVINTCAFIKPARDEARDEIERILALKRDGKIERVIVAGCLVQKEKEKILACWPEVDILLGINSITKAAEALQTKTSFIDPLPKVLKAPKEKFRVTLPHTAYLKISDGCDHHCTFCTIPAIRGKYRSKPIEEIVAEAKALVETGVKEINLVAQDTTFYGKDLYGRLSLVDLLKQLVKIDQLQWIRIMYAYPEFVNEELLSFMAAEEKICKYLDMPLQHISDPILRRMGRRLSEIEVREKIKIIKRQVPGIALRTTLIVGFPGETDEDFAKLGDFIREVEFRKLGLFTYWQEKGTIAAGLKEQVSDELKEMRIEKLIDIQSEVIDKINSGLIGNSCRVLLDSKNIGRTETDAPEIDGQVSIENSLNLAAGDFADVKITAALGYRLEGVVVT